MRSAATSPGFNEAAASMPRNIINSDADQNGREEALQ